MVAMKETNIDSDGSDAEEQPKRLIVEEKKDFDIQNLISDT